MLIKGIGSSVAQTATYIVRTEVCSPMFFFQQNYFEPTLWYFFLNRKWVVLKSLWAKLLLYYTFVKAVLFLCFNFIKAFVSGCKPNFCNDLLPMEGFRAIQAEVHHPTTLVQSIWRWNVHACVLSYIVKPLYSGVEKKAYHRQYEPAFPSLG